MPKKGKSRLTRRKGVRKGKPHRLQVPDIDTCVISNTNKITADVESQNAAATTAGSDAAPQKDSKEEKNAKNPRAEPSHPPTSVMVKSAIKGLKERGGSSLQAIKRYIADNYEADAEKLAPFIKKYIRGAVGSGILVQKKGKGASGSFRLASFADYRGSSSSRKKRKAKAAAAVSSSRRKKRKAGTAAAVDERSLSWKIFNAFATDTQLSLTEDEIKVYVTKDLGVAIDSIPMPVVEMLPTIVVAFMNMWSGWLYKSDFGDEFPKAHYYQWFRIYMKDKMSAIRGQYAMVSKSVEEQVKCIKVNSEKKATLDPDISPFSIYVECPAQMLNTIVFSNVGEDVIMKQHIATDWEDLSTTQLLNWPHVEVSFRTQDMCFVRRQATEYSRYLNFMPQESVKHTDVIIEEAKLLTEKENGRRCIGYEYLQKYLDVYMETIKNHKQITACKFDEIRTILSQFLEDVKFMDVNKSIATDTLVLFRLSPVPFIRNKKLVKNSDREKDEKRVAYCEIITPKIELVLLYFNAEQTDTPYLSFKYIENIKTQEKFTPVVPFISYKCTFCNVDFTGYESKQMIMEHLKKEHKMEQHMRCMPCKKQFNVLNLAACRWRHKCQMVETQK